MQLQTFQPYHILWYFVVPFALLGCCAETSDGGLGFGNVLGGRFGQSAHHECPVQPFAPSPITSFQGACTAYFSIPQHCTLHPHNTRFLSVLMPQPVPAARAACVGSEG